MASTLRHGCGVHAGNYRHQADVAHAYQVLVKGGMPTDRIVVMMEDDIASNPYNPVPGKVGTIVAVQCPIVWFVTQAKNRVCWDVRTPMYICILCTDQHVLRAGLQLP